MDADELTPHRLAVAHLLTAVSRCLNLSVPIGPLFYRTQWPARSRVMLSD